MRGIGGRRTGELHPTCARSPAAPTTNGSVLEGARYPALDRQVFYALFVVSGPGPYFAVYDAPTERT